MAARLSIRGRRPPNEGPVRPSTAWGAAVRFGWGVRRRFERFACRRNCTTATTGNYAAGPAPGR